MPEVSIARLSILRATYLLLVVGLGVTIWPGIVSPPQNLSHMSGVARSVLGAVAVLAVLGIRYPLKMLPLLFFELVWKVIWVLAFGLPLWASGRLDPNTRDSLRDCLMGVVLVPLVMPWGYVIRNYLKAAGDRWRDKGR